MNNLINENTVNGSTIPTINENTTLAVGHRGGQPHFLYGILFCDECGAPMTRRTLRA